MDAFEVQVAVGVGLLVAVVLWCQLQFALFFQSMDRFGWFKRQGDREDEFLREQIAERFGARAGCWKCMYSAYGVKVGDPCEQCGEALLSVEDARRYAREAGNV